MIALALAALAADPTPSRSSSAGLQAGSLAFKGPGRHDLAPAIGAWTRTGLGPAVLTGDLLASARGTDGVFAHRTAQARLGASIGVGAGDHRAHTGIGLGPALVLRTGSVGERSFVDLDPGLRALTHFDLRLGRSPVALRYQLAALTRGIRRWDFDVLLGIGAWL